MPLVLSIVFAILMFLVVWRMGFAILRALATPIPEPPPPGELRKVKIMFRCPICGTEVRMTIATHEEPVAPRHCQADMDLVAPVEE